MLYSLYFNCNEHCHYEVKTQNVVVNFLIIFFTKLLGYSSNFLMLTVGLLFCCIITLIFYYINLARDFLFWVSTWAGGCCFRLAPSRRSDYHGFISFSVSLYMPKYGLLS